jgi:hypothetical protein
MLGKHLAIERTNAVSTLGIIVVIILILLFFGGLPRWGYHKYGYWPSGTFGIVLLIVVILLLMGRL